MPVKRKRAPKIVVTERGTHFEAYRVDPSGLEVYIGNYPGARGAPPAVAKAIKAWIKTPKSERRFGYQRPPELFRRPDGNLRGLRGTPAQHEAIATRELGLARKALSAGSCAKALDHAVTARENARWGGSLFERAEADELVVSAHRCLKGA